METKIVTGSQEKFKYVFVVSERQIGSLLTLESMKMHYSEKNVCQYYFRAGFLFLKLQFLFKIMSREWE